MDRVAVGCTGIEDRVADGIRRFFDAPTGADLSDVLGLELAFVGPSYIGPDFSWKRGKDRRSFFGVTDKTCSDGHVDRPLRGAATAADVEAFAWPPITDYTERSSGL